MVISSTGEFPVKEKGDGAGGARVAMLGRTAGKWTSAGPAFLQPGRDRAHFLTGEMDLRADPRGPPSRRAELVSNPSQVPFQTLNYKYTYCFPPSFICLEVMFGGVNSDFVNHFFKVPGSRHFKDLALCPCYELEVWGLCVREGNSPSKACSKLS